MRNGPPALFALFSLWLLAVAADAGNKDSEPTLRIKDNTGNPVGIYENSHALIFAASDYMTGWSTLPSVVKETLDIKRRLEEHGFLVRWVHNPDDETLREEFELFFDRHGYDQDNRLIVFFSGHGYSRKNATKGYLVPIDAPNPRHDEKGFLQKALPMNQIIAWSRQIEAKHVLFLFDSCFSGTIFKTRTLPQAAPHISSITSRPVRQFITAGGAGEEVPATSVFAKSFLRGLRGEADLSMDGYITGSELGMYLHDKILSYGSGQTPQYGKIRDPDLDEGDFVFVVRASEEAVSPSVFEKAPPIPPHAAQKIPTRQFESSTARNIPVTAFDLEGIWITEADRGYKIRVVPTGKSTFKARYTNISNDNVFEGELRFTGSSVKISVTQNYGNGQLYGTYSLKLVSPTEILGTLTDYAGGPYPVSWRKEPR